MESKRNIGRSFLGCIRTEIISWCRDHNNNIASIFKPGSNPKNSEKHEPHHVFNFVIVGDIFSLGNQIICSDFTHGQNAGKCSTPNQDCNYDQEEIKNWDKNDSLCSSEEICRSINNVNSKFKWFETANYTAAKSWSKNSENNTGNLKVKFFLLNWA